MLTTFHILNGFVDLDATKFFDLLTTTHTRGLSYKLFTRYFAIRIIKKWNSSPSNIVEATSINDFRNKFDNYF